MNSEFYKKLVDMYAGCELSDELENEMQVAAFRDPELSHDMATLRQTVDALKSTPPPEFTEESYQRVLMKLYTRGVDVQPKSPTPSHLQYYLPIQG
jgi:anti-sigma factor RsiW